MRALICYLEMMPVIKAEESLMSYQVAACGAGPKNKKHARQIRQQVREWSKTMRRYSNKPKAQRAASFEEMQALMASMGVRMKNVGGARG